MSSLHDHEPPIFITLMIILAIMMIGNSGLLGWCVTKISWCGESFKTSKNFCYSVVIAAAMYILTMLFYFLMILGQAIAGEDNGLTDSMGLAMPAFYFLADWFRLLSLALRLSMFKMTNLAVGERTIKAVLAIIFTMLTLIVLLVLMLGIRQFESVKYLGGLYMVLNVTSSVWLMALFFRQFYKLVVARMETEKAINLGTNTLGTASSRTAEPSGTEVSRGKPDENADIKNSVIEMETIQLVTRMALLVCVSITSSFFCILLSLVGSIIDHGLNSGKVPVVTYSPLGFDAFINGLCLCLMFKFCHEIYGRICGCGHSICEKCCANCFVSWAKRKGHNIN